MKRVRRRLQTTRTYCRHITGNIEAPPPPRGHAKRTAPKCSRSVSADTAMFGFVAIYETDVREIGGLLPCIDSHFEQGCTPNTYSACHPLPASRTALMAQAKALPCTCTWVCVKAGHEALQPESSKSVSCVCIRMHYNPAPRLHWFCERCFMRLYFGAQARVHDARHQCLSQGA
jgi:hypothetical protein